GALEDFTSFTEKIRTLISTPDLDPVSYLDMERAQPHSAELAAPLRLDCAITYRLPQGTHVDYAPVKRVERELATDEWKKILDKAWHAGIPHIVFTGGEATLRTDLVELIAHAEKNGQVCGLLTDGLKLADARYLQALLESGLDHVMLILQPEDPRSWEAIETILPQDLFLTVHLTLDRRNSKEAEGFLQRLAEMSVANISLSTSDPDLLDELLELQGFASTLHLTMRWDLPVPYSSANPVTIETREEQMQEGKGRMWMYVEPDGDVLPAQGQSERVLGNLLRDDWSVIQPP
ncbi:MAG: radical SAM protein, partial [Chloroflexi bacterium]|nr:radical SAM protein [Chloroflexota bacterium]